MRTPSLLQSLPRSLAATRADAHTTSSVHALDANVQSPTHTRAPPPLPHNSTHATHTTQPPRDNAPAKPTQLVVLLRPSHVVLVHRADRALRSNAHPSRPLHHSPTRRTRALSPDVLTPVAAQCRTDKPPACPAPDRNAHHHARAP